MEYTELAKYSNSDIMQALKASSMSDALMQEEEWLRKFQYHENRPNAFTMSKFYNGSGDEFFVLQKGSSIVIKGFDHESPVSPHSDEHLHARDDDGIWLGMYAALPEELGQELQRGIYDYDNVTFCIWRESETGPFSRSVHDLEELDDGSDYLLGQLYFTAADYMEYAEAYYEGLTDEQRVTITDIYKSV